MIGTRFGGKNIPEALQQAMMRAAQSNGGKLTIGALRALSPFPENAQKYIDQAVVRVGVQRLAIAADIMRRSPTPLPDALSFTEVQWEQINKSGGAQRTMQPGARGENQLQDRRQKRIPVYCTTDDFNIGIRSFLMSQRVGQPIDVTQVEEATRRVNEAVEDATLNGAIQVDGYSTPGVLNAPNANTYTLPLTWTDPTATANLTIGGKIFVDVEAMITKLQGDLKFGPYGLYVGTAYGNALDGDYKSLGDGTIRDRLLKIPSLQSIVVADQMPATSVVLMQLTSDVADMIVGQTPTVLPWTSPDGLTLYWMVMAILVPRIRDDYDGNSGICIGTV